jgi:hypothetical protein
MGIGEVIWGLASGVVYVAYHTFATYHILKLTFRTLEKLHRKLAKRGGKA